MVRSARLAPAQKRVTETVVSARQTICGIEPDSAAAAVCRRRQRRLDQPYERQHWIGLGRRLRGSDAVLAPVAPPAQQVRSSFCRVAVPEPA
jgi:hypothetical protein